ncbi:MAG: RIO1 family regulatory kinase/ATPase [Hyalangium sp.]|uniref:RIO1 family regulatory kinase/ATPase domain-containing protein n=1 Tax=Hyalangium sp. TaxID=2028555 RepID=UPI00389A3124
MHAALEVLLADGVIDEVVARLKSGKEADVYIATHGGQYVAAKIYKERSQRNFKNNAGYKEGRLVRNSRTRRAMEKGSRFGQEAEEEAWKTAESDALSKLHTSGVRVPAPVMFYEGVLLMELVVDTEGQPAPRLIDALLTPELAVEFYRDLRQQAVRILCCDLIHGDLSPYNILLGASGPTIIDFPQTVAAAANSQAEFFFKRDVDNLLQFFAGYDRSLLGRAGDASEIWRAYVRRELTPDFEPSGRGMPDARGPRAGGRPGGRPQAEGRPLPPRERPHAEAHEAPAAAAPEVEDEFALLRQGGGERPKVAQLAKNARGGERSHRGGPGGGPRGGHHPGRPNGGGKPGAPGGKPGAPGGKPGAPHGGRPPHAGGQGPSRGGHPRNGGHAPPAANARHGGTAAQGGHAPQGGQASHGGHAPTREHAPHGGHAPTREHAQQGNHAQHGGHTQHGGHAPHSGTPHPQQGGHPAHRGSHRRGGPPQHGGQPQSAAGGPGHRGGDRPPRGPRPEAAPRNAEPPGPRGGRPPRQGGAPRRGTAPVVTYVSRNAGAPSGGSTEEP